MASMSRQDSPGESPRGENDDGRKDDFPGIHRKDSAAGSWSAAANTVFSKSWATSRLTEPAFAVEAVGLRKDHAARSIIITRQGAAARHSARAQKAHSSITCRPFSTAIIRFSKAKGTCSLSGLARAAFINLRWRSSRFIQSALLQTSPRSAGLQILLFSNSRQDLPHLRARTESSDLNQCGRPPG